MGPERCQQGKSSDRRTQELPQAALNADIHLHIKRIPCLTKIYNTAGRKELHVYTD
jgi:hypothetical protein